MSKEVRVYVDDEGNVRIERLDVITDIVDAMSEGEEFAIGIMYSSDDYSSGVENAVSGYFKGRLARTLADRLKEVYQVEEESELPVRIEASEQASHSNAIRIIKV